MADEATADWCSPGRNSEICWFCKKGRHGECMQEIMVGSRTDGPHDCTFDAKAIPCRCRHRAV